MDHLGLEARKFVDAREADIEARFREIEISGKLVETHSIAKFPEDYFKVALSKERLHSAVKSYFYDVYRYKHFHGMLDNGKESLLNFPKVYAYTLKWLLKEKPFYVVFNKERFKDFDREDPRKQEMVKDMVLISARINELIAIDWIKVSHYMHAKSKIKWSKGEERRLCYNLKFRELSVGFLELYFNEKVELKALINN